MIVHKITRTFLKWFDLQDDKITKIKLTEAITHTDTATKGTHVKDSNVVSLMRYYELVGELDDVHKDK